MSEESEDYVEIAMKRIHDRVNEMFSKHKVSDNIPKHRRQDHENLLTPELLRDSVIEIVDQMVDEFGCLKDISVEVERDVRDRDKINITIHKRTWFKKDYLELD